MEKFCLPVIKQDIGSFGEWRTDKDHQFFTQRHKSGTWCRWWTLRHETTCLFTEHLQFHSYKWNTINRKFLFIEHLGEGLTNTWEIFVYMIVLAARRLDWALLRDLEGWRDGGVNICPGSCVMSSSNISHMDPSIYHTHLTSEGAGESLDKNLDQPENEVIALSCREPWNFHHMYLYNQIVKPNLVPRWL